MLFHSDRGVVGGGGGGGGGGIQIQHVDDGSLHRYYLVVEILATDNRLLLHHHVTRSEIASGDNAKGLFIADPLDGKIHVAREERL